MKKFRKLLRPGRALRLQLFLGALIGATMAHLLINLFELNITYHETGSFSAMWHEEWDSGKAITSIIFKGPFQLFLLALGWGAFFRMRVSEMGNIRLRRSEAKYRSIINHAGEAIFLLDARGAVLEWNKAAEDLFNLPRRNVLNKRIQDLDLHLDRDVDQALVDIERARKSLTYETRLEEALGGSVRVKGPILHELEVLRTEPDPRFGGTDVPGRYAASERDNLEHCSPDSLGVVGEVTLEGLSRIAARLSRIDRFRESPLEEPLGGSDGRGRVTEPVDR